LYLTQEEKDYVKAVYSNVLDECVDDLVSLNTTVTANELEMKDDERMNKIDAAYESAKDKYAFTRSFTNSTRLLIAQRSHEEFEIGVSGKILNF